MNYGNGYQHYKEQSVTTMTKGEMLNLLYDELIKRLNRAKIGAQQKDFELFDKEVDRCVEIVNYLIVSLNRKYAISADLSRMYEFFNFELSRLRASRNQSIVDDIVPLIVDLRDTFKEADKLSKKGNNIALEG